jgi:hypothetical protein
MDVEGLHVPRKEAIIMIGMTKFLIACSTIALPLAVTALPVAAVAQSNDFAYCKALTDAYRHTASPHAIPATDVPVAMAKCEAGDTAIGIPMLEHALTNAKVVLPPHS